MSEGGVERFEEGDRVVHDLYGEGYIESVLEFPYVELGWDHIPTSTLRVLRWDLDLVDGGEQDAE
jgi:hypothetical protein